ncbi:MAG: DMT family transporter [Acidobacteria bacterium]|nr:DMT family transporter [Acidobacteriota bacterium]
MSLATASLSSAQALGIPVALIGAVFLAIGSQLQQHGVETVESRGATSARVGLRLRELVALARRPSWLLGTLLLGLAIVLQLFSLYLAPLTVVQPLGAVALIVTVFLNARVTKKRLNSASVRAVLLCVIGVGAFVTLAAMTTTTVPIQDTQLAVVVVVLTVVLATVGIVFAVLRKTLPRLFYVIAAGVLFGFVATLAKVLITRIQSIVRNGFHLVFADWLTIACFVGLIAAALLGSYFVQTAYSTGSPSVVVAGLTVVDPLVGVTIGIVVLGEAGTAPWWVSIVFILTGAVAVLGVYRLSRQTHGQPSLTESDTR